MWKWLVTKQRVKLGNYMETSSNGVPQGATASPGLWNVYCDPLLRTLSEFLPSQMSVRAYADDICITSVNYVKFVEAITLIEQWCEEHNMVINKEKSGIMVFDWKLGSKGLGTDAERIRGYPVVA